MKLKFETKVLGIYDTIAEMQWLLLLVIRLTLGWIFIQSGWGKLHNLSQVVEFFTTLGIPLASVQAPFIAGLEFIGGTFVVLGLLTRPFSFLLASTMVVAIITAKRAEISSFSDLAGMSEFLYLLLFLSLIFQGAGKFSLDRAFKLFRIRS